MDVTSLISTVVSDDSVNQISRATSIPAKDVQSVLASALPSLLGGALQQSSDESTAAGFANALTQHSASDTSNLGSFLGNVDLGDGAKIIAHLLGGSSSSVVNQASQQSGISAKDTMKILSIAAPLIMSLLGKQTSSQQSSGSAIGSIMSGLLKNADIGKILLGLLK